MKANTLSSTTTASVPEHSGDVGRQVLGSYTARLLGMLAFDVVLLLVGLGFAGFAWQPLCFFLLPPILAGGGAGSTFAFLNRMALRKVAPAAGDSPPGRAHVADHW
jgi:hypothetical protein